MPEIPESLKDTVLKDFNKITEINQATLPGNNDYQFTENLGLIQAGQNNYYDIRESSFNMEIIDRIINNMLTAGYSKEEIDNLLSGIDSHLAQLAFKGAMVKLTQNQSVASDNPTIINWDGEHYDIGNFFDTSVPDRLVVPAGVSRVKLHCTIVSEGLDSGTFPCGVGIFKNGSDTIGNASMSWQYSNSPSIPNRVRATISTAVIDVVAGDYFVLIFYHNRGSALNLVPQITNTTLSIEVIS